MIKKTEGIKLWLCQMDVVPGRPDINLAYMEKEIKQAEMAKADFVIFPEECLSGYVIGDMYEDDAFVMDVITCNERIRFATRDKHVVVIFGTLAAYPGRTGEDGRMLKSNVAAIAQHGEWIGQTEKTLQPNYRIFDDGRHMRNKRIWREEEMEREQRFIPMEEMFEAYSIVTRTGRTIKFGAICCEDMWDGDYFYSPTKILARLGAEIIFNLSCSNWSWQKNRKRHSVVKALLAESKVIFVYVNNTGVQNNGKNLIAYDGSSTVYDRDGNVVFVIPPFFSGSREFVVEAEMQPIEVVEEDDTTQMFNALFDVTKRFLWTMPASRRKMIIGLSGGKDSALSALLYVLILGPENVFLYNLPMDGYSGTRNMEIADEIARNLLGEHYFTNYEVVPIKAIVDAIAEATGITPDNARAYGNIQARARMEVLAGKTEKIGGLFSANCNKVEIAFGYGTQYADIAGYYAAPGGSVAREVYQLLDYMEREAYRRQILPREVYEVQPTAEIEKDQKDPFDYGNLKRRGYHDEMVRAFTEFRRNPEWFLERYLSGMLEQEFKLPAGHLSRLFPTPESFVDDLEEKWRMYHDAYRKRVQAMPVPIMAKRDFGYDLRESMVSTHFTSRYYLMRDLLLRKGVLKKKVAVYGGSFNPPGIHHQQIVEKLQCCFDTVIVVPCGNRADKPSVNVTPIDCRRNMAIKAFPESDSCKLDLYDLDADNYTPSYLLDIRYKKLYPDAEIWHVIGEDIIAGGAEGNSEIHQAWNHGSWIWDNLSWAVLTRKGYGAAEADLPPNHLLIEIEGVVGSGTIIRERLKDGFAIDDLVSPKIAEYIYEHDLYLE